MERLIALASVGWEINCFFRKGRTEISARTGDSSFNVHAGEDFNLLVEELCQSLAEASPPVRSAKPRPQEISFEFLFGQTDR